MINKMYFAKEEMNLRNSRAKKKGLGEVQGF